MNVIFCHLSRIEENQLVTTKNMRNGNRDSQSYSHLNVFIAHIHHMLRFINYHIKENLFRTFEPRGIEIFNN